MKNFLIHTFGCQMNVYDSEKVASMMVDRGWLMTENEGEADLFIINTCSVREKPLQKVFSLAGRYFPQKNDRDIKIFVMGCVAQQMGREIIDRTPYIDGVFGPGAEYLIPDVAENGPFPFVSTDEDLLVKKEIFPETNAKALFSFYSSSVTIMHGCNNFCSYCIVPFLRGREISRNADTIIKEINTLVDNGVREVTLLGQNVNSYVDKESNIDFPDLLKKVAKETELMRLRFVTSHPKDFNQKLAETMSSEPKIMPYLHLPAQSGSNRILKLMGRKYTVESYIERIEVARKYMPDISLSSDFIVGFPTETEADFEATLKLVKDVGYDTIFAFKYSPRPFTKAANMEELITEDEKLARLNMLLDSQRNTMKDTRGRFLDRTVSVLIEEKSPKGSSMMGRNEHNLIVHALGSDEKDLGKIINVNIKEILENTLRGDKI